MTADNHIRNPIEWGTDQFRTANLAIGRTGKAVLGHEAAGPVEVRRIEVDELWDALAKGMEDFKANRTDVMFVAIIYPLAGLVLAQLAFGSQMLPLLFPLGAGFALLGPVAAVGLYEMSRRREQGLSSSWADAFGVMRAPAFGAILVLGLALLLIFLLWMGVAYTVNESTFGAYAHSSIGGFLRDVFTTTAGWTLIVVGVGIGFLFAVLVLTISVVSFPMLLDRDVGLTVAVETSVRAVAANPGPMAVWGLIVAGGLVLGSIPALLGLIVVMPVLGHATWHLYRKLVA